MATAQQHTHHLPSQREIFIAAGISLFAVLVISWFTGLSPKLHGDEYLYLRQSENPSAVIGPPHGFRLLTPRLVWALPIPLRAGFYVSTVLGSTGAFTLIFILLRVIGCSRWIAAAAMVSLIFHRGIHDCLFHYCLIDPLSFFLIELSILAIFLRRDGLFSSSLLLGVLNRATSLFLVPVYHFARWSRWWSPRALLNTLYICGISLVAFFATRYLLYALSDEAYFASVIREYYDLGTGFSRFDEFYLQELRDLITRPERWRELLSPRTLSAGFGVMAPLSILGFWWGRRESRALVLYLLCVWSQILYAHMIGRLVFFAFPAFMVLGGEALRRLDEIPEAPKYVFLVLLAIFGVFWSDWIVPGVLLSLFLIGLLWAYRRPICWNSGRAESGDRSPTFDSEKSSPSRNDLLRTGLSWINILVIAAVVVNLIVIYIARPTLIGRLQTILPELERVNSVKVGSPKPVIIGDGQIVTVKLKEKQLHAFCVSPKGGGQAYAVIPAKSPLFRGYKKMVVVAISYPVEKSKLYLSVSRPDMETGTISFKGSQAVEMRFDWATQFNVINKSFPFECTFKSPNDYLLIWATEGVYVVDAFFLECERYTTLKRNLQIRPDEY